MWPVPTLVGRAENAEIFSAKPRDPAAKGDPVAPRRGTVEIAVVNPHVHRTTIGVERGQSVRATAALAHEKCLLLRGAVGTHHLRREAGAPCRVEHLRHLALYVGVHRADAAARNQRRSWKGVSTQGRQPALKIFPRFTGTPDRDETDAVRVHVTSRARL